MRTDYKTVFSGGEAEIIEKKSRFLATVRPVASKEDAETFLAEMKKKYWDATHNCFACVVGTNNEYMRSSDDGEPGGTAGRPMLDVLLKEDIKNAAIVVTRYFGGTLLGTGGLVRAYQLAAKEGIAASEVGVKKSGEILRVTSNYNDFGKIQHMLAQRSFPVLESNYGTEVIFEILIPTTDIDICKKDIINITNANSQIESLQTVFYADINGKPTIFPA